jgi:hypothetical protein
MSIRKWTHICHNEGALRALQIVTKYYDAYVPDGNLDVSLFSVDNSLQW